jgi:hypothetical protein
MKLTVSGDLVLIDAERQQALQAFAGGRALPRPQDRTVARMIAWLDKALSQVEAAEGECDSARYAGLVLDKQYLRLVERGLIQAQVPA